MLDAEPVQNLNFYMNDQGFYFLIELAISSLHQGYDKIDDLGPFLSLKSFLILVRLLLLQSGVKHCQTNLDQLDCVLQKNILLHKPINEDFHGLICKQSKRITIQFCLCE